MGLTLLETITIVVAGMMVGNELCVSIVDACLRRLDERTRFDSTRALAAVFGAFMPFWYAATLLLTGGVAFSLRANGMAVALAGAAALLWLISIVYTLTSLVPIATRIAAVEWEARPSGWTEARRTWDTRHIARVALLMLALAFLVSACLLARA